MRHHAAGRLAEIGRDVETVFALEIIGIEAELAADAIDPVYSQIGKS
jgi:hypothetical protein